MSDVPPEQESHIKARARELFASEVRAVLNFWDPQDFHADVRAYTEEERDIFDAEVQRMIGSLGRMRGSRRRG